MNHIIEKFARNYLKENIQLCTEGEQHVFKRMYSPKNLDINILQVVDKMSIEKLDWAMMQVEKTLKKNINN